LLNLASWGTFEPANTSPTQTTFLRIRNFQGIFAKGTESGSVTASNGVDFGIEINRYLFNVPYAGCVDLRGVRGLFCRQGLSVLKTIPTHRGIIYNAMS
jgi:hypothetical protein